MYTISLYQYIVITFLSLSTLSLSSKKKMSSETEPLNNKLKKPSTPHHHRQSSTSFRWAALRRGRQRLPTVRLGGGNKPGRRGFSIVRLCRRAKLKWLRLKYGCMLKKLKKYYDSLVKEMIEGSGAIQSFQQRMLLESSFAVPVMGLSFNTYPSRYALDHKHMF
ncbi:PREDICTED: uncharacterized protein LOC105975601 [Erythranthe guttata]|uniref:uncharacterized protein LOC105975601 n=1 Tax=Erythranthe guttata TaxID=4155 RepID=UPI00064D7920|nr:PREDICTED: uncharacterized protein LOC105975601 [Erythranthe guttata]|eukprot:XP_012856253.1 PREDICTED: uncharacterized protein LOC105975601 [Erythranthe guttata]